MDFKSSALLESYFSSQLGIFKVEDLCKYLRGKGVRITKTQAMDLLNNSSMVFALVDDMYITRAGVFTGRYFSFKPTKEEVQKGYVILGHRCMPFINPDTPPDRIVLVSSGDVVLPEPVTFSMNLAMDVFALYGEGYIIPYILNDNANESVSIASLKYNMPSEVTLTAWPLNKLTGKGKKFRYGDRILCSIMDWENNMVRVSVQHTGSADSLSAADMEREEWYYVFENGLLDSFQKSGPTSSIEEQLAFLFLENQRELCTENCGSAEEFLQHTKKIGFSPYGVESRIWRTGENVPYIGPWNEEYSSEALFSEMSVIFTPEIVNCYLKNRIYESQHLKKEQTLEELCHKIFPPAFKMTAAEFKLILLNIEKCNAIISESYNQFAEYKIAPVRNRVIALFSDIVSLLSAIGNSGLKLKIFPQQELVILTQLFSHSYRIIEDMEDIYSAEHFPVDDISLSLEGMEETFDDIGETLRHSLEVNTYNNIKIVD
jgi:hypothetical protein